MFSSLCSCSSVSTLNIFTHSIGLGSVKPTQVWIFLIIIISLLIEGHEGVTLYHKTIKPHSEIQCVCSDLKVSTYSHEKSCPTLEIVSPKERFLLVGKALKIPGVIPYLFTNAKAFNCFVIRFSGDLDSRLLQRKQVNRYYGIPGQTVI